MDAKERLQRGQISVYAVAVVLAIEMGLGRPQSASAIERFISAVLAVLLLPLSSKSRLFGSAVRSGIRDSWLRRWR